VLWDKDTSTLTLTTTPITVKHFSLLRVLGKGSFGKVVLVRKKYGVSTNGLFAMKVLRKSHLIKRKQIERTKTERRVLSVVEHPFIMSLHYAFQSSEKLYLVLDYCPGGELFFHLSRYRRFPERVARFYAAELLLALGHLHSKSIIYRDLKPENVLLDAEGHVKLGDFGLAKDGITSPTTGANSMCGTPEYMAPEVLMQSGHGFTVDYWGLGMLIYEMFTGLPPWYTTDKTKLFKRLKSAPLTVPNYISSESQSFVRSLLERDPNKRLGVAGCESVQKHTFFSQVNWATLLNKKLTPPIRPCEGLKLPVIRSSPMPIDIGSGKSNGGSHGDGASNGGGTAGNYDGNNGEAGESGGMVMDAGGSGNGINQNDYSYSMSPDTIDLTTQNFDPAFTKLSVNTADDAGGAGGVGGSGDVGGSGVSDDGSMFVGFSYDQQVKMKLVT
jgi:serum/glucocorticoid-regulated kinase 2